MCRSCGCGGEDQASPICRRPSQEHHVHGANNDATATLTNISGPTAAISSTAMTIIRCALFGAAAGTVVIELNARVWPATTRRRPVTGAWFQDHRITALNLMTRPGPARPRFLERSITLLKIAQTAVCCWKATKATDYQARGCEAAGAAAVQINRPGLHLDAEMWRAALPN